MQNSVLSYLQLGTNLGNRPYNLDRAITLINALPCQVIQKSQVYETEAWGIRDQPAFLNQVILISTTMDPHHLLDAVLNIEIKMGRIRVRKWMERLIDIDILYYGQAIIDSPRLTIPHPHIQERNFVLVPLAEIAPNFLHPIFNSTSEQLLANSKDPLEVKPFTILA